VAVWERSRPNPPSKCPLLAGALPPDAARRITVRMSNHPDDAGRKPRISVTVEPALREAVEDAARRQRRPVSNFVRTVLAAAVERERHAEAA
jgi:hypothetical protein